MKMEADLSEPSTSQRTQDCSHRQKLGDRFERKPPDNQPARPTPNLGPLASRTREINFLVKPPIVSFVMTTTGNIHTRVKQMGSTSQNWTQKSDYLVV